MIRVQNNTATRTPIPQFLRGLKPASLADLSWTDPALGVQDAAWWPEVDQSTALGQHERYGAETLTVDAENQRVIVTREVVPWTAEEIEAEVTAARTDAKERMLAWINGFLEPFTKKAADAEPHAWEKKAAAAHAYPNGTAIQTMLIEVEASVSGETPAELCAAIKFQEELYAEIIAFTTGLRRKTVADIDTAQPADIPDILDAAQAAAITKAQELGIA